MQRAIDPSPRDDRKACTNIGIMGTRDEINGCISDRLDEIDGLIQNSAAGALPQGPIWLGWPFLAAMPDSQYRSATQSGAVSLLPNQEQARYASIYAWFDQYHQAELDEQAGWADLRTLEKHPAGTPVLDWQLRSAMQKARTARFYAETAERNARAVAAKFGVKSMTTVHFAMESACIPLNTERLEAEKEDVRGGLSGTRFDYP